MHVSRTSGFFEEEGDEDGASVADGSGHEISRFSEEGRSDDTESSKPGSPRPNGNVGGGHCGGRDVKVRGDVGGDGVLDG